MKNKTFGETAAKCKTIRVTEDFKKRVAYVLKGCIPAGAIHT